MKKLLGLLARGGAGGGDALPAYYVFRDEFDGSQAAAWTDHGANYAEAGGTLTATQSPGTWDEPRVHTAGIARAAGRTLAAWTLVGDRNGDFTVGWAGDADADDTRDVGHSWVMEDGALAVSTPNGKVPIFGTAGNAFEIRPMEYLYCSVLNDRGAVHLLRPFDTGDGSPALSQQVAYPTLAADEAWVVYADSAGTDATLHPAVNFLADGSPKWRDLRVVDVAAWSTPDALATLADRFDRADSATDPGPLWTLSHAGGAGITSNKLYFTATGRSVRNDDVGFSDGTLSFTVNLGASASNKFVIQLRRASASNAILLTNVFGADIRLLAQVAGVNTGLAGTAFTWNANTDYRFVVTFWGNKYKVIINGVDALSGVITDSGNNFLSATGFVFELSSGTAGTTQMTVDDFAAYPAVVTLPDEILHGLVPQPWTLGSTITTQTFTAANGTALAAHDADWTERAGDWDIQSNRVVGSGAGIHAVATYDAGTDDYEISADFVLTGGTLDAVRAGLVARYADADNFTYARLFEDPGQPGTDEVEIDDGAGIRKAQWGDYWDAGETVTQRLQAKGDLMRVYVDGQPVLSHVTTNPTGDPGLYVYSDSDDDTAIDNVTIKAVS